MFRIDMLQAREGDCVLITYGDSDHPHRFLIDGGRKGTYTDVVARLSTLPTDQRELELLVVTHIDRDHIEGVLSIVADPNFPVTFRDVWFNGYHHLFDGGIERYGAVQGEILSEALEHRPEHWNAAFGRSSVELRDGQQPIELAGGLTLRLLSPDRAKLEALIPSWNAECRKAGMVRGVRGWRAAPPPAGVETYGPIDIGELADRVTDEDTSAPNGTSIVVLAEYAGRRALLAADCHPDLLLTSIRALAGAGNRLELAAFKLPHHGSRYNVTRDIVQAVSCSTFLVSTNGSIFHHPHPETIARLIKYADVPTIVFNYGSPETVFWDNAAWRRRYGYQTSYPADPGGVNGIDLLA